MVDLEGCACIHITRYSDLRYLVFKFNLPLNLLMSACCGGGYGGQRRQLSGVGSGDQTK